MRLVENTDGFGCNILFSVCFGSVRFGWLEFGWVDVALGGGG
jgi:hypothetical protein